MLITPCSSCRQSREVLVCNARTEGLADSEEKKPLFLNSAKTVEALFEKKGDRYHQLIAQLEQNPSGLNGKIMRLDYLD